MSDDAELMAQFLNGNGAITRRAAGNWMARCPAHNDGTPSLAIRVGNNGKLMYRCHAGCTFGEIKAAIENMGRDPFNGKVLGERSSGPAPKVAAAPTKEPAKPAPSDLPFVPYKDPDWLSRPDAFAASLYTPTERQHVYRDLEGRPLMTVSMSRLHRGEKLFLPVTPREEDGAVVLKQVASPSPRLPYGAEHSRRIGPVFITEGEKKADVLRGILNDRYCVISAYGGSPENLDLTPYQGRTGIMIMDHDSPGYLQSFRYDSLWPGRFAALKTPFAKGESDDIADLAERQAVTMSLIANTMRRHAKIERSKTNYLKRTIMLLEAGRRMDIATTDMAVAEELMGSGRDHCRVTMLTMTKDEKRYTGPTHDHVPLLVSRTRVGSEIGFAWFNNEKAGAVIDLPSIKDKGSFADKQGLIDMLTAAMNKRLQAYDTLIDASEELLKHYARENPVPRRPRSTPPTPPRSPKRAA